MNADEIAAVNARNAEVLRTQTQRAAGAPIPPRRLSRSERKAEADRRYFANSHLTEEGRHVLADPAASEPVFESPYTPVAAIAALGPTVAYVAVKHIVRRHKAKVANHATRESDEDELRTRQLEELRRSQGDG
jgi:hypothetical protein